MSQDMDLCVHGIPSVVVVNVGSFATLSGVWNIEYIQHYSMDMQSGKIVAFKNKMYRPEDILINEYILKYIFTEDCL